MTEVIMPKMGDGMEEGTLVEWLKKDGDTVKSGEVIGTIQTDKATLELESPGSGMLSGLLIGPGDTVPVGKPIAILLKSGEAVPDGWGKGGTVPASAPVTAQASVTVPVVETPAVAPQTAAASGRVKASPLARKIAAMNNIDLGSVAGTGPGGRVVEKDVRSGKSVAVATAPMINNAPVVGDQTIALSRLRKIIAERTSHSKSTVPHFYVTVEVDCENMIQMRKMFEQEESGKVSFNDFIIKASVLALQDMPIVNSTFAGDQIVQHGSISIGVAAAVEDGLLVPTIHNCAGKSLRQLSKEAKDLVAKARDGKLLPDEMQGSTFSISNMGMLNVDLFTAIINEPNCAIVAVSSTKRVVVPNEEDEIEIRTKMNLTGSFDHRVVDGALGAKFMNILRDYLQNPTRLLS